MQTAQLFDLFNLQEKNILTIAHARTHTRVRTHEYVLSDMFSTQIQICSVDSNKFWCETHFIQSSQKSNLAENVAKTTITQSISSINQTD